jgi:hypothetical protein
VSEAHGVALIRSDELEQGFELASQVDVALRSAHLGHDRTSNGVAIAMVEPHTRQHDQESKGSSSVTLAMASNQGGNAT